MSPRARRRVSPAVDAHKRNALHYLCIAGLENREVFLKMRPRFLTQARDEDGLLPLHYAVRNKCHLLARLILEIDSYADVKACYDCTPPPDTPPPHNVNRYGFVVGADEPMLLFQVPELTKRQARKSHERVSKWHRMLAVRDKPHPKFASRLFKGVPDEVRGPVWRFLLLSDDFPSLSKRFDVRFDSRHLTFRSSRL